MSAGKDYLSLPLRTFWADLASRSPTPGGGSVAASVGATAASLGCMVVEYTIGKPRFAEHESRLQSILAELKAAAETFGRLMAADMEAYGAVVAARKLDAVAQAQANAKALAVPMEIVALAAQVAALLDELGPITNPQLNGDLRISLILAVATADSAATLVRDNLPNLSNEAQAAEFRDQLDNYLTQIVGYRSKTATV